MNSQKSIIKYILGIIVIAIVIIGGYFIFKGKTVAGGASLHNIPNISLTCRPTIGANGQPVAPAPSLTVVSPNGGETFTAGQQITVKWTSCNYTAPVAIDLVYYPTGSTNYTYAQNISGSGVTANDGSELVTLPTAQLLLANNEQLGGFYKILINNGGSPQTATVKDASDNLFTISNNGIDVTLVSTNFTSTSLSSNNTGVFTIAFKVNAGTSPVYIASSIANTVIYNLGGIATIPAGASQSLVNITDPVTNNAGLYQVNPGSPEIFKLMVTATIPNTGPAGVYRLALDGIKWGLSATSTVPANVYSLVPPFATSYQVLN